MKSRFFSLFFCSLFLSLSSLHCDESYEEKTVPDKPLIKASSGEGYTINFDNIPATELVKFISKIGQ